MNLRRTFGPMCIALAIEAPERLATFLADPATLSWDLSWGCECLGAGSPASSARARSRGSSRRRRPLANVRVAAGEVTVLVRAQALPGRIAERNLPRRAVVLVVLLAHEVPPFPFASRARTRWISLSA